MATKFLPKWLGQKRLGSVMIVGQNPGKQRNGEQTGVVWEGNRSADFLLACLDGISGVFLTNACNYQDPSAEDLLEGSEDLRSAIEVWQPKRVICLGEIAYAAVDALEIVPPSQISVFFHPSFVVRFNKDKDGYKESLVAAVMHG